MAVWVLRLNLVVFLVCLKFIHVQFPISGYGIWFGNWDQLFGLLATAMRHVDILVDETDLVQTLDLLDLVHGWCWNWFAIEQWLRINWCCWSSMQSIQPWYNNSYGVRRSDNSSGSLGNWSTSSTKLISNLGLVQTVPWKCSSSTVSATGGVGYKQHRAIFLVDWRKILAGYTPLSWWGVKVCKFPKDSIDILKVA